MPALETTYREDDLEIHLQVVKLEPSRYTAYFWVGQRVSGTLHSTVLLDRQHAAGIECASAVTAESLAFRAAHDAALLRLGREHAPMTGKFDRSWIGNARIEQAGEAFVSSSSPG